jgi:hypothetical protein
VREHKNNEQPSYVTHFCVRLCMRDIEKPSCTAPCMKASHEPQALLDHIWTQYMRPFGPNMGTFMGPSMYSYWAQCVCVCVCVFGGVACTRQQQKSCTVRSVGLTWYIATRHAFYNASPDGNMIMWHGPYLVLEARQRDLYNTSHATERMEWQPRTP